MSRRSQTAAAAAALAFLLHGCSSLQDGKRRRIETALSYQILGLPDEPAEPVRHTEVLRHLGGLTLELEQQSHESDGSVSMAGTAWDCGSVLADFITNPASGVDWEGRRVVELGSGLGACAIAAAMMGARVTATDVSSTSIRLLWKNAARYENVCRGSVTVAPLLWGDMAGLSALPCTSPPDIVMASDVVYKWCARESLRATIDALCPTGRSTAVILAHRWRVDAQEDEAFFRSFEDLGFERTQVEAKLLPSEYQRRGPDGRLPVSIFVLRKP